MRRKRLLLLAMVALALAGLVSFGAYRLMRGAATGRAPVTTPVVVAAVALPAGSVLKAADLAVLQAPPGLLPQHVYHTVQAVAGRVLTAGAVPKQMLVSTMVARPGEGAGLPPLIPPGMRAVSVKVNDVVSVAGFALPGTHVDVLLTGNPASNDDPRTVTTITLLSNVEVLTAGQQLEQNQNGKPVRVNVVTLLVTPEGAEKLALAEGYGHLQLALRNPLDRQAPKTPPVLNGALYRRAAPVVRRIYVRRPAPAPKPWAVDLISGDTQQVLHFPATDPGGRKP